MSAYKEPTVSLRYRTGLIASRIGCGALLVATLLVPRLHAQNGDGMPFESVVDQSSYLGQTPLRVWHRTRGYGEETAETAFGTHWATPTSGGLAFMDGQFRVGNSDQDFSVNLGGGFRWRNDDAFTGSPRILGASFWFDGEDTQLDNWFNQLGVSFERLGPLVDLRLNANIPLEDVKAGDDIEFNGDTAFTGNTIAQTAIVAADASLRTVDFEIAPRLFNLNAWAYAGGYQMDGDGVSEFGEKGGVRGYLFNDLVLDVGVNNDDQFGTTTVVQIIWTPGRVSSTPSNWSHNIDDRMREQVYRNSYVAVARTSVTVTEELTDVNGDEFNIVHVDSTAGEGGNGTIESPFNDLADVNTNTNVGDIIFVHSESTFTGQSVTLKDAQRFLGEGNDEEHLVVTSEVGEVALPESAPGAGALDKPEIIDATGDAAIILAGLAADIEDTAEIEVSNFTVDGGARAVYSPTGVGDVNINRMMIQNIAGDGNNANFSGAIELSPLVETLEDGTKRVRFTPTISEVMFTGSDVADSQDADDDIKIDATTAEPGTTPITETIALSDITITGSNGVGIRLVETKRAATITDYVWNGETTGNGALLIDNTVTQGTVTMNGVNNISGGQAVALGTSGPAFGIRLDGGAATHTVTGTTINNMGGDAVVAVGGTAGLNFTGRINQTVNAGSILDISGGHDGNMTFVELTANEGVVNATTGDGLQFNDADGVYTFTDNVAISGVAAGGATSAINVIGDSTAAITLADATIANINGDAITFVGGTANLTLTGTVSQTLNAFSVLDVSGGHDGTLDFNERAGSSVAVINATTGDGLQFTNADGTYTFDEITLTGTTEGIGVDEEVGLNGGSNGTFSFTDADNLITNPAGSAIRIQSSDSTFTYNGAINAAANATPGPLVLIGGALAADGNTGGTVVIGSAITSSDEGILVQNNTGGAFSFSGAVALTTGAFGGVRIEDNTGGSTTFNNLDITTTTGDAFTVLDSTGHAVTVTGTDNVIVTTTGLGINMNNSTVGASGVNFRSVSVNGAASAIVLTDLAGGTVTVGSGTTTDGQGGTIQNTTNGAVLVDNANVSLNRMNITNTDVDPTNTGAVQIIDSSIATLSNINITNVTDGNGVVITNVANANLTNVNVTGTGAGFDGIEVNHNNATASTVNISLADITTVGGQGIDYNRSATADSNLTLNNNTISGTGAEGIAIDILGSSTVDITINGTNDVQTTDDSALLVTSSGGAGKIVRMLVTDNSFVNDDGTDETARFEIAGGVTFNATVTDNTFTNLNGAGTARAFDMNLASGTARLNLNGNTGTSTEPFDFLLTEGAGATFEVVDLATVSGNNPGGVDFAPAQGNFTNIAVGQVALPQ
jgi:hypothetical protein